MGPRKFEATEHHLTTTRPSSLPFQRVSTTTPWLLRDNIVWGSWNKVTGLRGRVGILQIIVWPFDSWMTVQRSTSPRKVLWQKTMTLDNFSTDIKDICSIHSPSTHPLDMLNLRGSCYYPETPSRHALGIVLETLKQFCQFCVLRGVSTVVPRACLEYLNVFRGCLEVACRESSRARKRRKPFEKQLRQRQNRRKKKNTVRTFLENKTPNYFCELTLCW